MATDEHQEGLVIKKLGLDLRLSEIVRDDLRDFPRLRKLRDLHFATRPAICLELPRLVTRYMKNGDQPEDSPELRAGKLYKYVLENKEPVIHDKNLLLGSTTTKQKGVPIYPDMLVPMSIWPELETISSRSANPFDISPEDIRELNEVILPYWMNLTMTELCRQRHSNPWCQQLMEHIIFYGPSKIFTLTHVIPKYEDLLTWGLLALMDDAQEKESVARSREERDFYRAVYLALEGVLTYALKLSDFAARQAEREEDPDRKRELIQMSEVCRQVPACPPTTFQEAVNSLWIYHVALHQENVNIGLSPGRLDQVLYPAFKAELETVADDPDAARAFLRQAVELLGCLWLKLVDHVPATPQSTEELVGGSGCNQAVTVGGINAEGQDAVNDLTYVILRVTEIMRLRDPNLNARYYPDVNDDNDYLQRLCEVNIMTGATPCFHNDLEQIKTLQKIYMEQGMEEKQALRHARDYGIVGCVEPSSSGRTFGHHGSIIFSLPSALELALFQGKHRLTQDRQINPDPYATPAPEDMQSFDDFKTAFATQLNFLVGQAVELNNMLGKVYQDYHPSPLLSVLIEGCMEKGRDVITGGATYNFSGAWIVGLAEVVDSLSAIQEFVFQSKPPRQVSFGKLLEAIQHNWQGNHYLQTLIKKSPHKFGTDSDLARDNAKWLVELLDQTFKKQPHYRGGRYIVGYYTMTSHAGWGKVSQALPSGRSDAEPFPSGITPVSGAAPHLHEVLDCLACLGQRHTITNGQALNLKFDPNQAASPKYAHCIKGYFLKGGLQLQSNIIDKEELVKADKEPEKYPELFVRVSGYSAYFKDLNPTMRQEIIHRTEYDTPRPEIIADKTPPGRPA